MQPDALTAGKAAAVMSGTRHEHCVRQAGRWRSSDAGGRNIASDSGVGDKQQ